MQLIEDGEKFDEMQRTLIGALVQSVKEELASEKLDPKLARDLLEKISFSIAVILDGSRDAEFDGQEAFPCLTFLNEDDDLISCGGGSWMHEYVFGVISEICGESAP